MYELTDKQYYKKKYKARYKMSNKELLLKALVFRIISSGLTAAFVFALTADWEVSWKIFVIDFVAKTALYYFFDAGWFRLRKKWYKNNE